MSDPRDPITPIHPQMPHSSSGGVIKKVGLVIAGFLLVVVITVVAVTHFDGSHTTHPRVAAVSSQPVVHPTSAYLNGQLKEDPPQGCVGGTDAANAISGAFVESISPKGAVEFTATMMRWLWSSDVDSTQLTSVGPRLASPAVITKFSQVKAKVPTGAALSFSTKTSTAWVKSFDARKGTAQVYFAGQGIATTTANSSAASAESRAVVDLTIKDGHWFMASSGSGGLGSNDAAFDTITSQIAAHGGPLSGGC